MSSKLTATGESEVRDGRQVDELETRVIHGLKKLWLVMKVIRKSRSLQDAEIMKIQ
jgi:hypothetical protein